VLPPTLTTIDAALEVLTAMITPALLISACGTFILSTSNRLARIIDRVRRLGDVMEALVRQTGTLELLEERRRMLQTQLGLLSHRAELLQRSLMLLYLSAGIFVASSVTLGMEALTGVPPGWVPVTLALIGAGVLLTSCAALLLEARLQVTSLADEMAFLRGLMEHHARALQPEHAP
jgi:Protein of unknown function (DUF2721)